MMRKLIAGALSAALLLTMTSCGGVAEPPPDFRNQVVADDTDTAYAFAPESPAIDAMVNLPGEAGVAQTSVSGASSKEIRAVWISYLEMSHLLTGKSESQFTANVAAAFENVKNYGLNTVLVQVRPFGDALYDSDYFPWSYTITGTEGKNPGFDPLAIMLREAKARGLEIEAWINPYRVRAAGNKNTLSADNQAKKWLDANSSAVRSYNGTTSYNPASRNARNLIVNGAVEIIKKYDVNGIHIDDYFYPTTDAAFDKSTYDAYLTGGGKLSLADWRRQNVDTLVKELYQAIKAENKNVRFGISPQSSLYNNYNAQYIDIESIIKNGHCDYVCPQIYFGYNNDAQPYKKTLDQWSNMVSGTKVKLWAGLAVYKIGALDSYAGSGKNEWLQNDDLMSRMVTDARTTANYGGFAFYRYDSIFRPVSGVKAAVQAENKNLQSILGAVR